MTCQEADRHMTTRTNCTRESKDDPIARALLRVWLTENAVDSTAIVPSDGFERRGAVRRDGLADVSVARVPTNSTNGVGSRNVLLTESGTAGRLIDLSTTGVSILFMKPLEINTQILVRLASREQAFPVDVSAHVLRSVELPNGEWKIVAEFDHPLCFDLAFQLTKPTISSEMT